jgi:hypothetical protein
METYHQSPSSTSILFSSRQLHLASARGTYELPNHGPSSPETTALIKESRYLSWDPTVSTDQLIFHPELEGLTGLEFQ